MSQEFDFERLVELCQQTSEETRQSAARAVDHSLVVRNWLFGRYIVEYEQNGIDRAEYGARTLENLSAAPKSKVGRGFSIRSLEQIRRFYLQFGGIEKTQPLSAEFTTSRENLSVAIRSVSTTLLQHLPLGWSHYVTLLTIDNPDARRFYEIEAVESDWSVRELDEPWTRYIWWLVAALLLGVLC